MTGVQGAVPPQTDRARPSAPVDLAALTIDPYPTFAALRTQAPVCWVEPLKLWYVTRYADVRAILLDGDRFTTDWPGSTIEGTFGKQMLTTDGEDHRRYRLAAQGAFSPAALRVGLEAMVRERVTALIDAFVGLGAADLGARFAARLPVQSMLRVVGLPLEDEHLLRAWYDVFERALANFTGDVDTAKAASKAILELHDHLDRHALQRTGPGRAPLIAGMAAPPGRLTPEEIKRNLSIIVFGGVSTVEALILNCLYALFAHPEQLRTARAQAGFLWKVVDETMRWMSPVQSAVRHVKEDLVLHGVSLREGEVVACMLGAANRDPLAFADPDVFDPDRADATRHLGFATGTHLCIGFHLARFEAVEALSQLLARLPDLRPHGPLADPRGYEFRQPPCMNVCWTP